MYLVNQQILEGKAMRTDDSGETASVVDLDTIDRDDADDHDGPERAFLNQDRQK